MNVKIFRFDPSVDTEPHYDSFSVEVSAEEKMTVMGLLEYISKHFDSSLLLFPQRLPPRDMRPLHGQVQRQGVPCLHNGPVRRGHYDRSTQEGCSKGSCCSQLSRAVLSSVTE